jgi:uncharacterized protein DUF6786
MKFAEVKDVVRQSGNDAYELRGRHAQPLALVAPSLSARVMATTFDGENGSVNGFVDAQAFREGMRDIWDNWGGEERYWLAPEGGQFGLMFQGKENCFANYHVQAGFNNQSYTVTSFDEGSNSLTMEASFELQNAAGTRFNIHSTRRITALDDCPYAVGGGSDVKSVGFESTSKVVNAGYNAWTRETGCLAHWHLGQFLLGPRVVAIIPFRQCATSDPPVREDYFREFCIDGKMPPERYCVRDGFVLLKADGKYRTKIGQNRTRATGLIASYNLDNDMMTFLDYDFYPRLEYAASYWYEQADPFHGDCISVSAEGPEVTGGPDGRCYELEALSPAMFLAPDQSFTFRTRTMHVRGPRREMATICRRQLGVEVSTLEAFARNS